MKRVGLLFFAIIALSLIWGWSPVVQAADKRVYEVGVDQLNVRSSPSPAAQVVGTLQQGDKLVAFQDKYGWYQTYYNGQAVWVASQFLIKRDVKQINNTSTDDILIVDDGVRARTGPGIDNKIRDILFKGEKYRLLETKNDWHKIKLSNDNDAWIASWLTSMPTTKQYTKSLTTNLSSMLNNSLHGLNIVLDAGHGGNDPGSISAQYDKEKDLTLQLTNKVAEKLRSEGATVILTRADDSYVSLPNRARISDGYQTHAFISLHFNAFSSSGVNGISTHYYGGDDSYKLAQNLQQSLMDHTNLRDRGVQQDNFYVLRETKAVAVLAELGFMSNPNDLQAITSEAYANNVADALAEALKKQFK